MKVAVALHIETNDESQFLGCLLRLGLSTVVLYGSDSEHSNIFFLPAPISVAGNCGAFFGKFGFCQHFGSQQRHDDSEKSCSEDVGPPNDQHYAEHWDAMRAVIEGALAENT